MSLASDMAHRAKEIRDRLRSPANAVVDRGINLGRVRAAQEAASTSKPESWPPKTQRIQPKPLKSTSSEPPVIHREIEPSKITIPMIIQAVADHYLISSTDLTSDCRMRYLSHPRQVAYYLVQKHCRMSSTQIGWRFGKDHTSILHGCKRIRWLTETTTEMGKVIREIDGYLRAGLYN